MKRRIRTDTEYEVEGKWWIPGKPEKKVAGTFRFDPQRGSTLKLVGSLRFESLADVLGASFLEVDDIQMSDYPVIFGQDYGAMPVSLFDSWTQASSMDAEGIFVNRALVGCHCPDRTTEFFTGIRLRLLNLERWIDHCAFTKESGFDTPTTARQQLAIRLKNSAHADICGPLPTIDADVNVMGRLTGSIGNYEANCEYQAQVCVDFHARKSLNDCCRIANQISQFFTLLIRSPAKSYEFELVTAKSKATILGTRRTDVREKEVWNPEMPCSYERIKNDFVRVLDGWIRISQELNLVVALLFEVLQVRGTVLESKFFTIAQAIEGLCAATIPFTYESEQQIETFRDAVLQAIPEGTNPGLRAKTKSWLNYANRPSLRSFITKMFRELDPQIKENILGDWEEDRFIAYAVDVRNTITHPSSGNVWDGTDHTKFRDGMDRLKLLVIVKLLELAGIPLVILRERYSEANRWTWG